MNIDDLREAQVRYENRMNEILETRESLYQLRNSFVRYFSLAKIRKMHIDEYVAGVDLPENGYNFCYTLERQLDGLGRIIGATAFKFGVYFGKTKSDNNYEYRFTQKFGDTYDEAFSNVKATILELLKLGEEENIDEIAENILSPMFKGKILCTFYPERYLNIFSNDHLDYFLIQLDLDSEDLLYSDAIYKREKLIEFKNSDPIMQNWSVDLFSNFLYTEYPGRPPRENEDNNDPLKNYRPPTFPKNQKAKFIDLNTIPNQQTNLTSTRRTTGKVDYEKENRTKKKLGDRGEKLVIDLEQKRLIALGRKDLASKVERVSLKSDSFGYDIISYEENGDKRMIEVKATKSKVGKANFYLTANELKTANEIPNFYIYMVYEVTEETPKVWAIKNPFNPTTDCTILIPTNYRVSINAN